MSRFHPDRNVSQIYPVAEKWLHACLVNDGSLFGDRPLWSAGMIAELVQHFVLNPIITPEVSFTDKLKDQLTPCPPEAKQLMAEFVYMLILFQTNMRPETKRDMVRTIWSWSGTGLSAEHPYLSNAVLVGIGSPGIAFQTQRWRELAYFIRVVTEFKKQSSEARKDLASSPDGFARWLDPVHTDAPRQYRNILLHLIFPDDFERITLRSHKRQIVEALGRKSIDQVRTLPEIDIDVALRALRAEMCKERGTNDIDFYDDEIRSRWLGAPDPDPPSQAWLLSWNPTRWDWTTFAQDRLKTMGGESVTFPWTCHNGKAAPGDRIFLVRLGEEPRGVIARGKAISKPYATPHYDPVRASAGDKLLSVDVEFDDIRDPKQDAFLRATDLERLPGGQHWTPEASGIEIGSGTLPALEQAWRGLPNPTAGSGEKIQPDRPPYTFEDMHADGCFISEDGVKAILNSWRWKKNLILQGPPGTGKSWLAKRLAYALIGYQDDDHIVSVQFHPNLSYEDFVRGWRPHGGGRLELVDGVFLDAIEAARREPEIPIVLLIEEINRGNPAQIFGEMLTLMEDSKRNPGDAMKLAYPRHALERVYVPDNLYIIGTMNVADRSLALVDLALRRRFAFVDLEPQLNDRWQKWLADRFGIDPAYANDIRGRLESLNKEISEDDRLGPQFRIGHSYVTPATGSVIPSALRWFRQVVATQIGPLLREYWYDDKTNRAAKALERLLKDP